MMELIIDRFEGNFAVCEAEEEMVNIERAKLPPKAKEGDILKYDGVTYVIDTDKTKERAQRIRKKMDNLFHNL